MKTRPNHFIGVLDRAWGVAKDKAREPRVDCVASASAGALHFGLEKEKARQVPSLSLPFPRLRLRAKVGGEVTVQAWQDWGDNPSQR
jgi:hypothetical protein